MNNKVQGASAGMDIAGALKIANNLPPTHHVAMVSVDSGLKSLAGALDN